MNFLDALKTGRPLRRPIPKHMGSNGDGWLGHEYVETLLESNDPIYYTGSDVKMISLMDIKAEDWEAKPEYTIEERLAKLEARVAKLENSLLPLLTTFDSATSTEVHLPYLPNITTSLKHEGICPPNCACYRAQQNSAAKVELSPKKS